MFLATTAIDSFWDKEDEIIFLGEWCKPNSKEKIWSHLNYKTLNYHWADKKKLLRDYQYLNQVYYRYLKALSEKLNELHNVGYSIDYWEVVIGWWLHLFIDVLFDRYSSIIAINQEYKNIKTWITDKNEFKEKVKKDLQEFTNAIVSDDYNLFLFSRIIEIIGKIDFSYKSVGSNSSNIELTDNVKLFSKIKYSLNNNLFRLNNKFTNQTETFFYKSYISKIELAKIALNLKQVPTVLDYKTFLNFDININIRDKIRLGICFDSFTRILDEMIFECIPRIYIEGYCKVKDITKIFFPIKCKRMYTANAHINDDIFKIWAAQQKENGARLIIAQHGGNYGSSKISTIEKFEIDVSNSFFSWGWNKGNKTIAIPSPQLSKLKYKKKITGKIYINLNSCPRYSYRIYSIPFGPLWGKNIDYQLEFLRKLPANIKDQIVVRPYPEDYGWNEVRRIKVEIPHINIELSYKPWNKKLADARLVIETTNLTTLLESLSANVPTILILQDNYWDINNDALPYFEQLKSEGIYFTDIDKAIEKIAEVANNPAIWWNKETIQLARKDFCHLLARRSDNWRNELLKQINN